MNVTMDEAHSSGMASDQPPHVGSSSTFLCMRPIVTDIEEIPIYIRAIATDSPQIGINSPEMGISIEEIAADVLEIAENIREQQSNEGTKIQDGISGLEIDS